MSLCTGDTLASSCLASALLDSVLYDQDQQHANQLGISSGYLVLFESLLSVNVSTN